MYIINKTNELTYIVTCVVKSNAVTPNKFVIRTTNGLIPPDKLYGIPVKQLETYAKAKIEKFLTEKVALKHRS